MPTTAETRPHRTAAELEEIAHAVSHDLAQPLTTISGFARLLVNRYELELDAQALECLSFIVKGATDIQETIDGLVVSLRGAVEETSSASQQSAMRNPVAA